MLHKALLYMALLCLWLPVAGQGRGVQREENSKGWQPTAVNIFAGSGKSILTAKGFSDYLLKISNSKKATEKIQFDSWYRVDGNWILENRLEENTNTIGGFEYVLKPAGNRKNSFYERQEMAFGLSISAINIAGVYNSKSITPAKTTSYTAQYTHKITDIRATYSYMFHNPVTGSRFNLFLGVTLYGSLSLSSSTTSTPTLASETINHSGQQIYTYQNRVFLKGQTSFMQPFYGYGIIVPGGLRLTLSGKSCVYAQGYLDFGYHSFARGISPAIVCTGIALGYRYVL